MVLSSEVLHRFNKSRTNTDKSIVCHAPTVNLNFEQNGNVRACCYNSSHILGKWPKQSIKEIWMGDKLKELRGYILKNDLSAGCLTCGKIIQAGNYQGAKTKFYDEFVPGRLDYKIKRGLGKLAGNIAYPKVMEFELSNQCNLECIMCNGYFSSSIRKNREHLPPITSPYDDKFVEELEEFIPHLTDAKFLGGEPFMIDIYLKIWERIRQINPGIRIHITTNGTFLNERIKDLLEGLKVGIIVSIDSIVPDTYRSIRVNGNADKVMENLAYFKKYTLRKKTFLSIAACPMVNNWKELPMLLDFCVLQNIDLYFNAVFYPEELSLSARLPEYLKEVFSYLQQQKIPAIHGSIHTPRNRAIQSYTDFVHMVKGWYEDSLDRPS